MGKLLDRRTPFYSNEPLYTRFPEFSGSLIFAIGQPGCGKTRTVMQLVVAGVLRTGLPALMQDPTGNARVTVESYALGLESRNKHDKARLLREACVFYSGRNTDALLSRIDSIVGNGEKSAKDWQAFVVFDDAVVIRESNPGFFEATVPLFRNAGILGYGTAHHDKAIPPAARQCVRYYLLWKAPGEVSVDDFTFDNDLLTPPRSNEVFYFDTLDYKRYSFFLDKPPPPSLTTPGSLTTAKPIVPRY